MASNPAAAPASNESLAKAQRAFRKALKTVADKLKKMEEEGSIEFGLIIHEKNPPKPSAKRGILLFGSLSSQLSRGTAKNVPQVDNHGDRPSPVSHSDYVRKTRSANYILECQQKAAILQQGSKFDSKYAVSQCPDWWSVSLWQDPIKMTPNALIQCEKMISDHIIHKYRGISELKRNVVRSIRSGIPSFIVPTESFSVTQIIEDEVGSSNVCYVSCKDPAAVLQLLGSTQSKTLCILSDVEVISGTILARVLNKFCNRHGCTKLVLVGSEPAENTLNSSDAQWDSIDLKVNSYVTGNPGPLNCSILVRCNIHMHEAASRIEQEIQPLSTVHPQSITIEMIHSPCFSQTGVWKLLESFAILSAQFRMVCLKQLSQVECSKCQWYQFLYRYCALDRPMIHVEFIAQHVEVLLCILPRGASDNCDTCHNLLTIVKCICKRLGNIYKKMKEECTAPIPHNSSNDESTDNVAASPDNQIDPCQGLHDDQAAKNDTRSKSSCDQTSFNNEESGSGITQDLTITMQSRSNQPRSTPLVAASSATVRQVAATRSSQSASALRSRDSTNIPQVAATRSRQSRNAPRLAAERSSHPSNEKQGGVGSNQSNRPSHFNRNQSARNSSYDAQFSEGQRKRKEWTLANRTTNKRRRCVKSNK